MRTSHESQSFSTFFFAICTEPTFASSISILMIGYHVTGIHKQTANPSIDRLSATTALSRILLTLALFGGAAQLLQIGSNWITIDPGIATWLPIPRKEREWLGRPFHEKGTCKKKRCLPEIMSSDKGAQYIFCTFQQQNCDDVIIRSLTMVVAEKAALSLCATVAYQTLMRHTARPVAAATDKDRFLQHPASGYVLSITSGFADHAAHRLWRVIFHRTNEKTNKLEHSHSKRRRGGVFC